MGRSPVPFPELLSGAGLTAHDIFDLGAMPALETEDREMCQYLAVRDGGASRLS